MTYRSQCEARARTKRLKADDPSDAPIQLSCAYCGGASTLLRAEGAEFNRQVLEWLAEHDCGFAPARKDP